MEISTLRLVGIALAMVGGGGALMYFRGARWNRSNLLLALTFCTLLLLVCLDPGVVTGLRDVLSLGTHEWGRLVALLVASNLALWFLLIYVKGKGEETKQKLDRAIMELTLCDPRIVKRTKDLLAPIMVLIPAFNEEENLKKLLPRIPSHVLGRAVGVVVIDDGSSDRTADVAEELGAICIRGLANRGQGGASRLGYAYLKRLSWDFGVTMDADNQHDPNDMEALMVPLVSGRADLVVGSRVLGTAEHASFVRRVGVSVFSWLITLFTARRITDCSSGFKAFNHRWANSVQLTEDQFQAAEVIIDTAKKGLRIEEVPISIALREHGETKKGSNFRYGVNFAKVVTKTWLRN